MSKCIISAFIAAAALLLLAGCSKEPAGGGEGIPMRVAASLSGDTRASLTTDGLTEFYLQLGCADAAYGYFGKVTKSGTDWAAGKQLFWKDKTTPVNRSAAFFGDHAFTEDEFANGVDLTVPADQSTQAGLNSADLLTLKAADIKYEDTAGGVLPVELSHGLTKLNFVLTLGEAFYDAKIGLAANPVTAFTVKGANAVFHFKPLTGDVTVTAGTQADITPLQGAYTPGTATAKAATVTFEAILVPQSFAAGALSVSFSVGAGNYAWSNASAITLSAGTTVNLPLSASTVAPPIINGHEYVDMGNGIKWATCNVGAAKPEDNGDYYAWAETETKDDYSWSSYKWMVDIDLTPEFYRISKYTKADGETAAIWYEDGEFVGDGKTSYADYDYEDDAARKKWGAPWRTPTVEEWGWLAKNCDWSWTTDYNGTGVSGKIATSQLNGSSLFFPAAGYKDGSDVKQKGTACYLWSSENKRNLSYAAEAVIFFNLSYTPSPYSYYDCLQRYYGSSVRSVAD